MTVTYPEAKHLYITGANCLDPIDVFLQDLGTGRGQVTIVCWGEAWSCFWGAIGERSIAAFFAEAGNDYLVNKLMGQRFQKHTKQHERYLARVCDAIKEALIRVDVL